jgi:hypothetical protein
MGPGVEWDGIAEIVIGDSEFGEAYLAGAVVLLELQFAGPVACEGGARAGSILAAPVVR